MLGRLETASAATAAFGDALDLRLRGFILGAAELEAEAVPEEALPQVALASTAGQPSSDFDNDLVMRNWQQAHNRTH